MQHYFRSTTEVLQTARNWLNRETTGGILLIVASIVAMLLANSPWAHGYEMVLKDDFIIGMVDHFELQLSLENWINDGLMVVFFVVAGLEMKREILVGELSSLQKAVLPMLAALGGILVPAGIYLMLNSGTPFAKGWGVPMATDIAYSLGILGLLGKRVPVQLKVFLTALAIADDLAAILVIAVFYSTNIAWDQMVMALGLFAILLAMNRTGVKNLWWYIVVGLAFWLCFIHSGIHPTIAGVLFALTVPVKPQMSSWHFREKVQEHAHKLEQANLKKYGPLRDSMQRKAVVQLLRAAQKTHPPLLRLENALIGFNAYVVLPLFALANAGVHLKVNPTVVFQHSMGLGIILGLVFGKSIGISLFTLAANRWKYIQLPEGIRVSHVIGMGFIAGVGFTMSLFISNLAFTDPGHIQMAKLSILVASMLAAVTGSVILILAGKKQQNERYV